MLLSLSFLDILANASQKFQNWYENRCNEPRESIVKGLTPHALQLRDLPM